MRQQQRRDPKKVFCPFVRRVKTGAFPTVRKAEDSVRFTFSSTVWSAIDFKLLVPSPLDGVQTIHFFSYRFFVKYLVVMIFFFIAKNCFSCFHFIGSVCKRRRRSSRIGSVPFHESGWPFTSSNSPVGYFKRTLLSSSFPFSF